MNYIRALAIPVVVGSSLLLTTPASAATDYYIKFDGIDGSATAKGYEKWIEFDWFNWAVGIPYSGNAGAGVGKPSFSDFYWGQSLDGVTALFSAATSGDSIKKVTVDFVDTSIGKKYFEMTFENAFITSLSMTGSAGTPPSLSGSFAYGTIQLDYWAFNPKGASVKTTAFYDMSGPGQISSLMGVYAMGLAGPSATSPAPEPETYAMFLAGLGIVGALARRRLQQPK